MARVLLAMSGGVDSSVSAALLKEQGHDVVGVFMRHGQQQMAPAAEVSCAPGSCNQTPASPTGCAAVSHPSAPLLPIVPALAHKQGCCTASDAQDARRVADLLDIPFYAINFEAEFGRIIEYFVEEYTAGRTPNPCVMCNNWLKFGRLWEYAQSIGAAYIATGHYARLTRAAPPPWCSGVDAHRASLPALCRGVDSGKDQAYVLFGIERSLLPRLMFPVGAYHKTEIRARAKALGLRVAEKKDSQEICFVTSGDYADFVRRHRAPRDLSGEIVTTEGKVVGRHNGLEGFTVGQRKGLGVALGERYFVVRLEPQTRRVVIGRREELAVREFTACQVNWLTDEDPPLGLPFPCQVKVRYLSEPAAATVTPLQDGRIRIVLDKPRHGVAPGQAAVCFAGDQVLGGGWIESYSSYCVSP